MRKKYSPLELRSALAPSIFRYIQKAKFSFPIFTENKEDFFFFENCFFLILDFAHDFMKSCELFLCGAVRGSKRARRDWDFIRSGQPTLLVLVVGQVLSSLLFTRADHLPLLSWNLFLSSTKERIKCGIETRHVISLTSNNDCNVFSKAQKRFVSIPVWSVKKTEVLTTCPLWPFFQISLHLFLNINTVSNERKYDFILKVWSRNK